MPHAIANRLLDLGRGGAARRLNHAEIGLVQDAFGDGVDPGDVRIVAGAGLSPFAAIAFSNGNPAIALGNSIHIKPNLIGLDVRDLSASLRGVEMLLHEYTHVVQYAALGFAHFGWRYVRELRAYGYRPRELYRYDMRALEWERETLEGQAQIVGHFARARMLPGDPEQRRLSDMLRARLDGTGIYGL